VVLRLDYDGVVDISKTLSSFEVSATFVRVKRELINSFEFTLNDPEIITARI